MNPYNFVRFGERGPREPPIYHDKYKEHNGSLSCMLIARTHLFIPQTQGEFKQIELRDEHAELAMMRDLDGNPMLPGSSLKGVLRSVAEAISGSCLTLPQRRSVKYRGRPPVSYQVPAEFEHCTNVDHLCPACRIFGFLSSSYSFQGKISISDAVSVEAADTEALTIEPLMEPKPRHSIWYEDPQKRGMMRGRKFYYHRPLGPITTTKRTKFNKTVEAVCPGTVFEFVLDYANLTDGELALLVFSLTLRSSMCHKVGMGKPVGLGSAKISIASWEKLDRRARYELSEGSTKLEGEALSMEVDRWTKQYHKSYDSWCECLSDLETIWRWDPSREVDVRYPSREWFNKNRRTPLDRIS